MFIFLPAIFYFLLIKILYAKGFRQFSFLLLAAAVITATTTILMTEVLSFFKLLTPTGVIGSWVLLDVLIYWQSRAHKIPSLRWSWPRVDKLFIIMAGAWFIMVLLPVTFTAIKAAPGTWDSMTYHLGRVEHWVQNQSLVYYPTNIERQLWKGYGAEIFILQFKLLTGADYWCNGVQLLSLAGILVAAWAIMGLWQRLLWEKLLAVILISTIPMAVLQASSTQNDLAGAFWLITCIYFLMNVMAQDRRSSLLLASLALGIAVLTKETNYLFAWPFVGWFLIAQMRAKGFWKTLSTVRFILMGLLVINAAHYTRNIVCYQAFLSPGTEGLVNTSWAPSTLLINVIRNTSMHLATPSRAFNEQMLAAIEEGSKRIGIQLQDTASMVTERFTIDALLLDEDYAPNPFHLLLVVVLIGYTIIRWRKYPHDQLAYTAALVAAMATFCLVLKWQPWHSRLHVGLFILACIPAAVMIGNFHKRWLIIVMMIFFMISSFWCVFKNANRPLIGEATVWNMDRHLVTYRKRYAMLFHDKTAADIFNRISCSSIGLVFGEDTWEYPFWSLMRPQSNNKLRLEHVDIRNKSKMLAYPQGDFRPCGLYMPTSDGRERITLSTGSYKRIWETQLPDGSRSSVFIIEQ